MGFSGTPSDLLPHELGRCDYETGDDGMMLTTVLDRKVTSYELLPVSCRLDELSFVIQVGYLIVGSPANSHLPLLFISARY